MPTQLYFWKPLMIRLQNELKIVQDYFDKTKTFFENIEVEAKEYEKKLIREYRGNEDTDYSAVAEAAHEEGLIMYQSLCRMKSNHLLMSISLLYHTWEQQLIKFTISELSHNIKFPKKVMQFSEVQTIFHLHQVSISETDAWNKILELKQLTNTIKHGDGNSANKLRKLRPDFFKGLYYDDEEFDVLEFYGSVLLDENTLKVNETDFVEYVEATISFWGEMPERAFADIDLVIKELNKSIQLTTLRA
jgi:hypothetical protein